MKAVSWMRFYPVSFSAVTGNLRSGLTTGTEPHHSVAEIFIIIKQLSVFDLVFCSTE